MLRGHLQSSSKLPNGRPPNTTTSIIPQAPRAMVQSRPALDQQNQQIEHQEMENLYPRMILFEALAGFEGQHKSRATCDDIARETRHNFLDSFAYLCDVEKGGATVTAAALQSLQHSDFLWLAANDGVREEVLEYANVMLKHLCAVTAETMEKKKGTLLKIAVAKCSPRIHFYRRNVEKLAKRCRTTLKSVEGDEHVGQLRAKLKKLAHPNLFHITAKEYVKLCHDMRGAELDGIKKRSSDASPDFSELVHHVWRVGATRSAVDMVVEAMITVPSLRRISKIRTVPAPRERTKTIPPQSLTPMEVLYGIMKGSKRSIPSQREAAMDRLLELDDLMADRPIKTKMAEREKNLTKVHAELQIADFFSRTPDMRFVDKDKYIGCSKPACYFCYLWLSYHKHLYVAPATHCKIIPGCRGPDGNLNEAGAQVMIEMYAKMSHAIGQGIFDFLCNSASPRTQHMSTDAPTRGSTRESCLESTVDDQTLEVSCALEGKV